MSDETLPPVLGDDDTEFFKTVHGRILNTLNTRYMLPVDKDEIKVRVSFLFHSVPTSYHSRPALISGQSCITDCCNLYLEVGTT